MENRLKACLSKFWWLSRTSSLQECSQPSQIPWPEPRSSRSRYWNTYWEPDNDSISHQQERTQTGDYHSRTLLQLPLSLQPIRTDMFSLAKSTSLSLLYPGTNHTYCLCNEINSHSQQLATSQLRHKSQARLEDTHASEPIQWQGHWQWRDQSSSSPSLWQSAGYLWTRLLLTSRLKWEARLYRGLSIVNQYYHNTSGGTECLSYKHRPKPLTHIYLTTMRNI